LTDYFALLNEPRRPWIEPETLKQKFLARSAQVHPDRVHNLSEAERQAAQQRYTELNSAYNCLREPKDRLRHLLELELGAAPKNTQNIPAALADLFLEISQFCRQTDSFLAEKNKITSPLLKVQGFERSQEWTEKLQTLQRKINGRHEVLLMELKELDSEWELASARAGLLRRLEELHALFGYFSRWNGQIQERVAQLSF
jgi:DnaJ-domain-containing protein 1